MAELETIYRETLRRCAPEPLVREHVRRDLPHNVVAIGKAGAALFDGIASSHEVSAGLVIVPHGYPLPRTRATTLMGGHPQMDDLSFAAGEALIRFVDQHDDVLFLVSGGGSACVEAPLQPWFSRDDLVAANARLMDAGIPIEDINCVRKHLSAIKGGRLGARVRGTLVTLVYSDVSIAGDLSDVASGPTLADRSTKTDAIAILERIGGCDQIVTRLRDESVPETVRQISNATSSLIASNTTLVETASAVARTLGFETTMWNGEIEGDVQAVADAIAARAESLRVGQLLVAGGEPTVIRRGDGRGGRCTELGVRFALAADRRGIRADALFGSSDGVDGNSGVAAVILDPAKSTPRQDIAAASLDRSDSLALVRGIGRAVIMRPTGNNLRDLYLVARR